MRLVPTALLASALMAGAAVLTAGSASALPATPATGGAAMAAHLNEAAPLVEDVRWRGRRGYHGHRGYYGYRHHHSGAGVAAGLLGGAIVGGIIASQARPAYAAPDPAISYCMQRFKSYDPASMTYLGYDGLRHPCP